MQTRFGAHIPDTLRFASKSTFFITLNVGGQPTSFDGRNISVRAATLADLEFASAAVNQFCNALLRRRYGRDWMSRSGIRFSVLAIPETRGKNGESVPLHFHIMFDGTGLAETHADDFKKVVAAEWTKIAMRRFGHVPSFKTLRSRSIKQAIAYNTKWLKPGSLHESAIITKSERKEFRVQARLHEELSSTFSQASAT